MIIVEVTLSRACNSGSGSVQVASASRRGLRVTQCGRRLSRGAGVTKVSISMTYVKAQTIIIISDYRQTL